ncbi:10776_t:CDS:2 [Dentiscutata erythropus]|uniref:10776_t:CDS:1 n=1 Tax=Dentiscutata erythropus TaxID=1348616 RepID=A0A9N9BTN5_9GLOM|nr:10776_t:CDS:2 [Dentiscutata erythropus]
MNPYSDKESNYSNCNILPPGLSSHEAWWNLDSDDDYLNENIYELTPEKSKEKEDFYLNKVEEIPYELDIDKLNSEDDNLELKFLGYTIGPDGISTNPKKVHSEFFKNCCSTQSPLKKNTKYKCTSKQDEAFKILKRRLISAPIFAYPDFLKKFLLFTDASGSALGAILSQKDNKNRERVIYYASRTMTNVEKNYSVTEQECLAVGWLISSTSTALISLLSPIIRLLSPY